MDLTPMDQAMLAAALRVLGAVFSVPVVALVLSEDLDDIEIVCTPGREAAVMRRLGEVDWRVQTLLAKEWSA